MNTYRRLFAYVKPYRQRLLWSIVCGILVSSTTALAALLIKPVLDEIFVAHDRGKLLLFPLAILGLYTLRGLLAYGHAYLMRAVGQRVVRDLRQQLFAHIQALPLGYLHQHHTGVWMSHITHDVTLMERAVTSAVHTCLRQSLTMLGLLGVAFYRDWFLALWAVCVVPLAGLCIMRIGRTLRRLSHQSQEHLGALSAVAEEVFSGIRAVKGFGREAYESERFQARNMAYYRVRMRAIRADELASPIMECLGAVGVAAVVWYGGQQVIAGATTPGTFFSFLMAILMLYEPLRRLSRVNSTIQGAVAAAERVFRILDTPGEQHEEGHKPPLPALRHTLAFQNVSLRYYPEGSWVLRHINLEVTAGSVVALIGMSGAGKTSLVHLLPRFYAPTEGEITIDGGDIQHGSLASLRAQLGIVSQDVILFDDTVRRNILYGNLQASEAQMLGAAQAAYAHDFVMQMPQGYDTVIGERGVRLSGGEKQRLAIARALLRNAPILILDEATSALDSASEQEVQYALDNLMKDRTTFVIAHRLSTVRHADVIVVLHQGRLVETGRHEELLAQAGHYRRLYDLQCRTQERLD